VLAVEHVTIKGAKLIPLPFNQQWKKLQRRPSLQFEQQTAWIFALFR